MRALEDLEGAAASSNGRVYLMTSFSRKAIARVTPTRKLVSFELKGEDIIAPAFRSDLRDLLVAVDPALTKAAANLNSESKMGSISKPRL